MAAFKDDENASKYDGEVLRGKGESFKDDEAR